MVLLGRIELPTSPLPRECSTSELQQPAYARYFLAQLRPDARGNWTLCVGFVTESA